MKVGPVGSAVLYGVGRGTLMLYNGPEIGEPGGGEEGFGGDDARTSIFDYWSMPELVKWTNGHRYDGGKLSGEQKELRSQYGRLLVVTSEPAFRNGSFFALNPANNKNPNFGQVGAGRPYKSQRRNSLRGLPRDADRAAIAFLVVVASAGR